MDSPNPLHEYEPEATAAETERRQRLAHLKQAISTGEYDDQALFQQFISGMGDAMRRSREEFDD